MRDVDARAWQGRYLPHPLPPPSACAPTRPGATRWRATRPSTRRRPSTRPGRGPSRPPRTSASSSSCELITPSAASSTWTSRCASSWPRSNRSARERTRCGCNCRRPCARRPGRPWRPSAPSARDHRYAVSRPPPCVLRGLALGAALEKVLGEFDAEWVGLRHDGPVSRARRERREMEAWMKKPRLPRRSRALTAHPIVRYIGPR